MMNDAGADLASRLHCEDDHSRNVAFIAQNGVNKLELSEHDDQTGFDWSTVPVINWEIRDDRLVNRIALRPVIAE